MEWGRQAKKPEGDAEVAREMRMMGMPEAEIEQALGGSGGGIAPDCPELWPENHQALQAFMLLSPRRPSGFGVAAIPVSEMWRIGQMLNLDTDESYVRKLCAADDAYLQWSVEKNSNAAT